MDPSKLPFPRNFIELDEQILDVLGIIEQVVPMISHFNDQNNPGGKGGVYRDWLEAFQSGCTSLSAQLRVCSDHLITDYWTPTEAVNKANRLWHLRNELVQQLEDLITWLNEHCIGQHLDEYMEENGVDKGSAQKALLQSDRLYQLHEWLVEEVTGLSLQVSVRLGFDPAYPEGVDVDDGHGEWTIEGEHVLHDEMDEDEDEDEDSSTEDIEHDG